MTLVIDAAPIVALADASEPLRDDVLADLQAEPDELIIPAPVTAEVDYLLQRLPRGESAPPAPRAQPLAAPPPSTPSPALSTQDWLSQTFPGLEKLARASVAAAAGGEAGAALRRIGQASGLGVLAGAQLRALVAEQLFLAGHDRQALRTARDALQRSRHAVGLAGYVGGLAAWRLGRADEARRMFDAGATAPSTAPDIAAGAGSGPPAPRSTTATPPATRTGCAGRRRSPTPSTAASRGGRWSARPTHRLPRTAAPPSATPTSPPSRRSLPEGAPSR